MMMAGELEVPRLDPGLLHCPEGQGQHCPEHVEHLAGQLGRHHCEQGQCPGLVGRGRRRRLNRRRPQLDPHNHCPRHGGLVSKTWEILLDTLQGTYIQGRISEGLLQIFEVVVPYGVVEHKGTFYQ